MDLQMWSDSDHFLQCGEIKIIMNTDNKVLNIRFKRDILGSNKGFQ